MNFERAVEAVLAAHERGGMVLNRTGAESLVRLVAVALGVGREVRESEVSDGDADSY